MDCHQVTRSPHSFKDMWYIYTTVIDGSGMYLHPDGMWRHGCILPEFGTPPYTSHGYYQTEEEARSALNNHKSFHVANPQGD